MAILNTNCEVAKRFTASKHSIVPSVFKRNQYISKVGSLNIFTDIEYRHTQWRHKIGKGWGGGCVRPKAIPFPLSLAVGNTFFRLILGGKWGCKNNIFHVDVNKFRVRLL